MSEKILKGRLVQKHDTAENWSKATSFVPKQGEVIVYDIDANYNYERMKIGDGKRNVNDLPFIDDAMPHTIKEVEIINIARDEFVAKIGTTSFNKDLSSTGVVFDPNKRYVFEFMGERKLGNISEQNYVLATFGDISIQITDWWGLYLTIYGTITESFTNLKIYELEIVELDNACLEKDVVIQNSISISRKGEIGGFSSALGFYTEASGEAAHAEGNQTKATGSNAHAEGRLTTASGGDSHVEGYNNVASGDRSHVEGSGNIASGEQAHAEGLSTLASSANQHVQGKYNIEDTTDVYAHIVGNGTSDSKRSNAHTLDWDGNAWFAGDVTVGADAKKLATEESVSALSERVGDTSVSEQISSAISEIPQPDWNQNDKTASDYIKNKPFGEEIAFDTYIEEQIVEFVASGSGARAELDYLKYIEWDAICNVYFDGVLYENIAAYESSGDMSVYVDFTTENGDRISICDSSVIYAPASYVGQTHTIKAGVVSNIITPIENKYLGISVAPGTGTNSVRLNDLDSTVASGEYSHAEGYHTTASGYGSHTEGIYTTASGYASHAEGYSTIASEYGSHAEGNNTTASGREAHAEGYGTTASGNYSHAEGNYTIARGNSQHVSGSYNIAETPYIIKETVLTSTEYICKSKDKVNIYICDGYTFDTETGVFTLTPINWDSVVTTTSSSSMGYSDVYMIYGNESGKTMYYNADRVVYDTGSEVRARAGTTKYASIDVSLNRGKYIEIVGNGTSNSARSNAHTLDWNGNAWFAGDVTVGADSKKLATEESVTALSERVGDTSVSEQIEEAVDGLATEDYVDKKLEDLEVGNVESATKATQDASGNVITTTYETKTDAASKLNTAKGYTDEKISAITPASIGAATAKSVSDLDAKIGEDSVATQIESAVSGKANTSDLTSHTGNTTVHITSEERTKWNTHTNSAHAPSNAQANVIESISVNGTKQTITNKAVNITVPTDNKDLANGAGYLVASDIENKADKATTLAGYGITDAATSTHTHDYAASDHTHTIDSALSESSTNPVQNKIVNAAINALDNKIGEHTVAEQISGAVANKVDKVSGKGLSTNDLTATLKSNYDAAYTHSTVTTGNPHKVTKNDVGLGNVENKSSATIRGEITSSNVTTALGYTPSKSDHTHSYIPTSEKGVASGVATLDTNGKVPSSQLPSYVDDVLEYAKKASFPATGETGKIYIDQATNKTYRWSGSVYTEISASLALGETDSTAYAGNKGKANADAITALQNKVGDTAVATQISEAIDDITPASIGAATSGHTHSSYVNQNAFSNVTVGSTTIAADAVTDTLTLVAGSNVTITPDATNDKITIAATDTTYSDMKGATSSAAGTNGLVPAPAAGKQASFLRGDGTWAVPTDTNTVTTATTSGSGNAVTSVTASNGALTVTKGETFATKAQLDTVSGLVGDTAVATQIENAVSAITPASIGAATTSHTSSSGSKIGTGTADVYGHVKLSNSVQSTYGTGSGYAATPSAVKEAYDLAFGKADKSHTQSASTITSGTLSSDRLPNIPITKGGTGNDTGYVQIGAKSDTTVGLYATAEGRNTTASGEASHAEGYETIASGMYSHAEGKGTIAASSYQHVQGKYNIKDAENDYIHIVGNGEGEGARSNAHTLDWEGNAWFAGDVTVGADNKKLTTEGHTHVITDIEALDLILEGITVDYVVEQGTANDGKWIWRKYNSGFCEAWFRSTANMTCTNSGGNVFYSGEVRTSYPFTIYSARATIMLGQQCYAYETQITESLVGFRAARGTSASLTANTYNIHIVGWWKQ